MGNYKNGLSYVTILDDIINFRSMGKDAKYKPIFNIAKYEDPTTFYFKIFFYFNNLPDGEVIENIGMGSNLLGGYDPSIAIPTGEFEWDNDVKAVVGRNVWELNNFYNNNYNNTALRYLIETSQYEAAAALENFRAILSQLSAETPWVFQEISGLGDVLKMSFTPEVGVKIDDAHEITIKCMTESYDLRLSTLVDTYREAVVDRVRKLYRIPENLRKFDMGIYIFPQPHYHFNRFKSDVHVGHNHQDKSTSYYMAGSKYIELHDCEFNINNGFDTIDTISNVDGTFFEYNLKIKVGQAYVTTYNEFLDACFGDGLGFGLTVTPRTASQDSSYVNGTNITGYNNATWQTALYDKSYTSEKLKKLHREWHGYMLKKVNEEEGETSMQEVPIITESNNGVKTFDTADNGLYGAKHYNGSTERHTGLLTNAINQGKGFIKSKSRNLLNKLVLGNLYGFSPKGIFDNVKNGNIGLNTVGEVKQTLGNLGVLKNPAKQDTVIRKISENTNKAIRKATNWKSAKSEKVPHDRELAYPFEEKTTAADNIYYDTTDDPFENVKGNIDEKMGTVYSTEEKNTIQNAGPFGFSEKTTAADNIYYDTTDDPFENVKGNIDEKMGTVYSAEEKKTIQNAGSFGFSVKKLTGYGEN